MNDDEIVRLAQNLARNCGYAVFPCDAAKRPTLKGWPQRASTEPAAIEQLWADHPGPLIGVATGESSGISLLDIDVKHDSACIWWHRHTGFLPATSSFRTRGGGVHLHFQHRHGVKNTQSKLAQGVDTRGTGGLLIHWFAAGFECLDNSPPAAWPDWLFHALWPATSPASVTTARDNPNARIDGVLRAVERASEGSRNSVLHWGACRLGELVEKGQLGRDHAHSLLRDAARAAGLSPIEADRTIGSGLDRAK
jgi:hypothetical protein